MNLLENILQDKIKFIPLQSMLFMAGKPVIKIRTERTLTVENF